MTSNKSENTNLLLLGHDVSVRVIPADTPLCRLFRHPGADFLPAPPEKRNGRLDPPMHRREDYAILYASDCLSTAAIEVRALILAPTNPPTYQVSEFAEIGQMKLQWTNLVAMESVSFIDLTAPKTAGFFGLDLDNTLDEIGYWRSASAKIFDALCTVKHDNVVGICYRSHRSRGALNYALFEGRYEKYFVSQVQGAFDLRALRPKAPF